MQKMVIRTSLKQSMKWRKTYPTTRGLERKKGGERSYVRRTLNADSHLPHQLIFKRLLMIVED